MLRFPIQSKNMFDLVGTENEYHVCWNCENIEKYMKDNSLPREILHNGWEYSQKQNSGAQDLFDITNLDFDQYYERIPFLHKLTVDEIKNSFWCRYCGSLIFTRTFCRINKEPINGKQTVDFGFSLLPNEMKFNKLSFEIPAILSVLDILNASFNDVVGSFHIFDNNITSYELKKFSSSELLVKSINNTLGNLKIDYSNNKMILQLNNNEQNSVSSLTTYFLSINKKFFSSSVNNITNYENFSIEVTYNNNDIKAYNGCIVHNPSSSNIWK